MSKPLAPYTPAVRAGDTIYVSGQLGMVDGQLETGVAAQTAALLKNMETVLKSVGASLDDVVKTTCFLADIDQFGTFNDAYAKGFGDHRPARSCFAVKDLPLGAVVEVEAIAYKPL